MAGAGYKLFATGDVLTASDVNTYLMQQTVMVFANAAARTTALSGVVSEGMLSYLKDTNAVEVYDGANWVASDDPNAIQNTIVAAKGDIIGASANDVPAVTSVGADGTTLVADSAATTGLSWSPSFGFSAGKNKIINGDFRINQRAFTSNTANGAYNFDRWVQVNGGSTGTLTITPQTFTPGTAPVSGYEAINYVQCVTAAGASTDTYALYNQYIEDTRTFAGQTVTLSFWAKATSGTPKIATEIGQNFGSGGSPSAAVYTAGGSVTLSTSWARYSITISVPSVAGKTFGTTANTSYLGATLWLSSGSDFNARSSSIGLQNATFHIWGVQLEAGSVATAFQTATGTLQGELAACQRYYFRPTSNQTYSFYCVGAARNTTLVDFLQNLPVTMRTIPTAIDYSNLGILVFGSGATALTSLVIDTVACSNTVVALQATVASGLTQFRFYYLSNNNNTAAFLGLSAEL
jgi:hypothetical protein